MKKLKLLEILSKEIISKKGTNTFVVGVNGVDGSGKTYLSRELLSYMLLEGHDVELISVDDFLNSREYRYQRGSESPEGFYYDTYNYNDLCEYTLKGFQKGSGKYCRKVFDIDGNKGVTKVFYDIRKSQIILVEGMFLFRPELIHFFNYKIFLDVTFENTLSRNIKRELKQKIGSVEDMIDRYNARYMPGQKLYLYEAKPKQKSDIIIDNNDFENPIISK